MATPEPRREVTAAAQRYTRVVASSRAKAPDDAWQNEAWAFYKTTPEIRFAARWVGNAMSAATLYAARRGPDGSVERLPDDHPATQIVQQIAGGPTGQADMLREIGPHLVVAGEYWTVIKPTINRVTQLPDGYEWTILSTREVQRGQGKLTVELEGLPVEVPAYDEDEPDDTAPIAFRAWEPSPDRRIEADSPVRSALVLLEELQLLNAAVAAIARSRITGRGVLLVPKGTRFPTAPGAHADADDDVIDVFMEVAATAIREPDSAAATVPIVLEVPAEAISSIKWLTFQSDFDEIAIRLRDEAIRRFITGLELPSEIVTGLGDLNHWSLWGALGEAVRLGVEPRLGLACNTLTTMWLRPMLETDKTTDVDDVIVWYDTSNLRTATNRAQTALEAFKAGVISARATRRETGFTEADAPGATPETTEDGEQPADTTPEEPSNVTTLPVGESPSMPDTLPASAAPQPDGVLSPQVVAAVDGLIWNALSAAGTRLRNRPACPRSERARAREMSPAALHVTYAVEENAVDEWRLLDGVWDRAPEVAARYGLNAECLTASLDSYVRGLIAARQPYSYQDVPRLLRMSPCALEVAA